jgi:protein TonB
MKPRKTIHADLERKRSVFIELGIIVSLAIVFFSMELNFKSKPEEIKVFQEEYVSEQEMIPITRQEQIVPPPPPKPMQVYDVITIVDNDVTIEDELEILDTETDQDEIIDVVEQVEFEMEEEASEAPIFMVVEEMPIFMPEICKTTQEGNAELMNYISKTIKYPVIAAENGIQGRVFVSFVVSPKGNVTNVNVIRGVNPDLDKEAVRVVMNLPDFSPGRQRGKPVRVQYSVPINFILQ